MFLIFKDLKCTFMDSRAVKIDIDIVSIVLLVIIPNILCEGAKNSAKLSETLVTDFSLDFNHIKLAKIDINRQ